MIVLTIVLAIAGLLVGGGAGYVYTRHTQGKAAEEAKKKLAKAKKEAEETIKKALSIDNVVVVDFWIDREENVYPMVPAGSPINQMLEFE